MRRFENLFDLAINSNASDLHISSEILPALRINGELNFLTDTEIFSQDDIKFFINNILSHGQYEKFSRSGDLDFAFEIMGRRFRGSVYREMRGISLAFRLIPSEIISLENLGLPGILKTFAHRHRGLFLATGPTGHGKSSTLAALIDEINRSRKCHIITIEDPIEFIHTPIESVIHQREVTADTENFATGIRHVLRQDPDVIMIGELRDLETISAAITAAETGHFVLGTLHTQDASQSVERIIDVFPPHQQNQIRLQLAYTLTGICSQQLLPAESFHGRVCATEVLIATPAVRSSIREGKIASLKNAMQTGMNSGMHTMEQDLARLFREGLISRETALDFAYDISELERILSASYVM